MTYLLLSAILRRLMLALLMQVCANNSVRLALERPFWTPEINHMFPPRFKVRALNALLSLTNCIRAHGRPSATCVSLLRQCQELCLERFLK